MYERCTLTRPSLPGGEAAGGRVRGRLCAAGQQRIDSSSLGGLEEQAGCHEDIARNFPYTGDDSPAAAAAAAAAAAVLLLLLLYAVPWNKCVAPSCYIFSETYY